MRRQTRLRWLLLSVLFVVCSAATPGDIGGCGKPVEDLDAPVFFESKKSLDCEACQDCELASRSCQEACANKPAHQRTFPDGCFPLTQDGVVCLRALMHASCSDYERFMSDEAPESPTECNFCPADRDPAQVQDEDAL